jgi:hypothetical protein
MACAIVVAIGLFPRRGDVLNAGAQQFAHDLSLNASEMLRRAEIARVPMQVGAQRREFERAAEILPLRSYSGDVRLAISAEHVQSWANSICEPYANFARLSLYSAGGQISGARDEANLWKYQCAELRMLEDLRVDFDLYATN